MCLLETRHKLPTRTRNPTQTQHKLPTHTRASHSKPNTNFQHTLMLRTRNPTQTQHKLPTHTHASHSKPTQTQHKLPTHTRASHSKPNTNFQHTLMLRTRNPTQTQHKLPTHTHASHSKPDTFVDLRYFAYLKPDITQCIYCSNVLFTYQGVYTSTFIYLRSQNEII